ncbi:MAG: dTDP-4-amino-4,6-dideoxyglucose formyltransferase [Firmicutes bacterium]|nr:dTDP-4-amino-4,6-dideoxyglucose formyltransferase [Bacillota bacterium]
MKYFVITDNRALYLRFKDLLENKNILNSFDFYCSPKNKQLISHGLESIDIKDCYNDFINRYSIGFSIHSKQMFPKVLVESIPCINVHPGYNPYNRGWYPQVFAIINNEKIGATLHFMDAELDNGKIIDRVLVEHKLSDTSESLYFRILDAEINLLEKNIDNILDFTAASYDPEFKGKLYLKKHFEDLCQISLEKEGSFLDFFNLLRATSFGNYDNSYIIDPENQKKIFFKLVIKDDSDQT